jgi:DNA-binding MarR family transcriptional regulator
MDNIVAWPSTRRHDCPRTVDSLALLPADLLVAAKLAVHPDASASVRQLGEELGMSKSAVAYSLQRLVALDLVREGKEGRRVNRLALRDCLEHAVRWIAPAKAGEFELGLPTANAAPILSDKLTGGADPMVMPLAHGPVRGRAVPPLHPHAPRAASLDPRLHALLALIDAFRVGRARDRQAAAARLRELL